MTCVTLSIVREVKWDGNDMENRAYTGVDVQEWPMAKDTYDSNLWAVATTATTWEGLEQYMPGSYDIYAVIQTASGQDYSCCITDVVIPAVVEIDPGNPIELYGVGSKYKFLTQDDNPDYNMIINYEFVSLDCIKWTLNFDVVTGETLFRMTDTGEENFNELSLSDIEAYPVKNDNPFYLSCSTECDDCNLDIKPAIAAGDILVPICLTQECRDMIGNLTVRLTDRLWVS